MSKTAYIGKSVPKVDAREKATGKAIYAADVSLPGMLYGKIVRCWEHAHAKVVHLDLSAAARVPGVVKVLGPRDVTQKLYNTGVLDLMVPKELGELLGDIEDQRIFTDHVRHQGDAICGIIAESEAIAELAAQKVVVMYEPLPVYLRAEESARPGSFQFDARKPGNRASRCSLAMPTAGEMSTARWLRPRSSSRKPFMCPRSSRRSWKPMRMWPCTTIGAG